MRALVIGATGGFGGAVARELSVRGIEAVAIKRESGREHGIEGVSTVAGDALDYASLEAAAARDGNVNVIVHGFNVPYSRWKKESVLAAENTCCLAEKIGATILFPGNVYGFGPDFSQPLDERSPRQPPTELGEIRNRIEERLRLATANGACVIIVRAGDYFGGTAANSWFAHIIKKAISGGAIVNPATAGVPHEWAYLPDVARAAVDLVQRPNLEPFTDVNVTGFTLEPDELIAALRKALGDPDRKVSSMPWWLMQLSAPFWSTARHLLQMRYLWQKPVLLSDEKLEALLPGWQYTPVNQAIESAISAN
jgi:nucleoside-diphosphate-sugar epimerase